MSDEIVLLYRFNGYQIHAMSDTKLPSGIPANLTVRFSHVEPREVVNFALELGQSLGFKSLTAAGRIDWWMLLLLLLWLLLWPVLMLLLLLLLLGLVLMLLLLLLVPWGLILGALETLVVRYSGK